MEKNRPDHSGHVFAIDQTPTSSMPHESRRAVRLLPRGCLVNRNLAGLADQAREVWKLNGACFACDEDSRRAFTLVGSLLQSARW